MKFLGRKELKTTLIDAGRSIVVPILAILLALLIGAVIISWMKINPGAAYASLFKGAWGTKAAISETLVKSTPLIFTGLAFAFAYRCGLFNIGGEGQLYIGASFAVVAGAYLPSLPIYLHLPLAICFGFLGGGLWGLICGLLKVRCGANEMITTVMFNYIATYLVSYLVTGPLKAPPGDMPHSLPVATSAQLPVILSGTRLHLGFILALLALVFYFVFLWYTRRGYEIRMVGQNMKAARYGGMNPSRNIILAMFLAGGMAGLAGTNELLGIQLRLMEGLSPNYGFDGIAVALVGRTSPVGMVLSAVLFGMLRSGGNAMQMFNGVPSALIYVIQGLVIIFVATENIARDGGYEKLAVFLQKLRKGGRVNG